MTIMDGQTVSDNDRPTLSACMIVKNEERFLPQCLKSIRDAVDEIIIVDTGSTDRTVEIAQSFGARIYRHPWRNDFSEARNHSLSHATCDWVLYIDADETLEQSDILLLRRVLCTDVYNAIFVAIYSKLPVGQSKHYYTRVFRRRKARFEGIVHEQLIYEGDSFHSEVRLYHDGYNLSNDEMQKKYERTGELLRRQVAENPNDIFAFTNLIRNYRNEYNYEKVIELGEKGLSIPVSQTSLAGKHQRQRMSYDLANALLNTNKLDRAEEVSKEALREYPDFLDNLLQLGYILMAKRAFNEALQYFKRFLIIKEKERSKPSLSFLIIDTYNSEDKVYNGIGECYKNLGLIREAEVAYKKAIELNNKEIFYYSNLAHVHISQNRLEEAEWLINTGIKQGITDHQAYLLLGKIQIMRKKTHEAIHTFKQLIQRDSKNIDAYMALINVLIQTNQLKEAEKTLEVVISYYPGHLELKCLAEKFKYKYGRNRESAIHFIRSTLKAAPRNSNAHLKLGYLCIEIEEYATAIELLEKYLKTSPPDANVVTNLAVCYARLGKLEPAIIGLQAALKLDPTCSYALQNLEVLKKKCGSLQGVGVGNDKELVVANA